jgi:hypothetical protein
MAVWEMSCNVWCCLLSSREREGDELLGGERNISKSKNQCRSIKCTCYLCKAPCLCNATSHAHACSMRASPNG